MLEELGTNPAGSARRRIQHRKSASDTFAWAASSILNEFAAPAELVAPFGANAPAAPTQHGLAGADRSTIDGAAAHHHAPAGGGDFGAPFGSIQPEDLLDMLQGVEEDELDLDMDDLGVDLDGEGVEGEHGLVPPAALEAGRGGGGTAGSASAATGATLGFTATLGSAPASAVAADAMTHAERQQQLTAATQQQQQQHLGGALGLHRRAVSCTMGGSGGAAAAAASGGGGVDGSRRGQSASSMAGAPPPRSLSGIHTRNPSDSLLSGPPAPAHLPPQPLVVDKPLSEFVGQTRANALDPSQLDPKRAKRIIANRQSAHRSRMKKLQVIHELEQQVAAARAGAEAARQQVAAAAVAEQAALVSELQSLGVAAQALPPPPPPPDAAAAAAAGPSRAGAGRSGAGSSPTLGGGGPGVPNLAVGLSAAAAAATAAAVTAAMSQSSRPLMQPGPEAFSGGGGAAASGAPALHLSGPPPLALPLPLHPDGPEHRPRLSGPGVAQGSMGYVTGGGDGGGGGLVPEPTLSLALGTRCSSGSGHGGGGGGGGGSSASLAAVSGGGGLEQPQQQQQQQLLSRWRAAIASTVAAANAGTAGAAAPTAATAGDAPVASSMAAQSQQPQHAAPPACGPFAFPQSDGGPPVQLPAGAIALPQQLPQQGLPAQSGRRQQARHSLHRRHMSAGCAVDVASWDMFVSGAAAGSGGQGLVSSGALALALGGACPPVLAAGPTGGDTEMALAGLASSHGDPLLVGHPSLRVRLTSASAHSLNNAVDAATAASAATATASAGTGAAAGARPGPGCFSHGFSKSGLSGQDAAAAAAEGKGAAAAGDGDGMAAGDGGGDGSPMALDDEGEVLVGAAGLLMADFEDFLVKEEPQLAESGSRGTLMSMMSSGA
ncbi:hypothetical protein PLESTM_001946700 [Pleodorina starrii]|nr:hypothetical protein PLESTM_001946700 [Pleodorina starrii]